jgi:hypothetical protein
MVYINLCIDSGKSSFTMMVDLRGQYGLAAFNTLYASDTLSFTLASTEGKKSIRFGPSDLPNIKAVTLSASTSYSLAVYDCKSSGSSMNSVSIYYCIYGDLLHRSLTLMVIRWRVPFIVQIFIRTISSASALVSNP